MGLDTHPHRQLVAVRDRQHHRLAQEYLIMDKVLTQEHPKDLPLPPKTNLPRVVHGRPPHLIPKHDARGPTQIHHIR